MELERLGWWQWIAGSTLTDRAWLWPSLARTGEQRLYARPFTHHASALAKPGPE